jgi:hypothetical protein
LGIHSPLETKKNKCSWAPPTKKIIRKTQTISTKKNKKNLLPFFYLVIHSISVIMAGRGNLLLTTDSTNDEFYPNPHQWFAVLSYGLYPYNKRRLPIGHRKSAGPASFTHLCCSTQRQSDGGSPFHPAAGTKTRCNRRTNTIGAIGHRCPGSAAHYGEEHY